MRNPLRGHGTRPLTYEPTRAGAPVEREACRKTLHGHCSQCLRMWCDEEPIAKVVSGRATTRSGEIDNETGTGMSGKGPGTRQVYLMSRRDKNIEMLEGRRQ